MKKLSSLFLFLLLSLIACAQSSIDYDGIKYKLSEKEAMVIYKQDKYTGSVIIPETIKHEGKTYNVTSIGDWAFKDCFTLTSVTIPNGVRSIGHGAFKNCSFLTSVTIPNSVTWIGSDVFQNCSKLTSIEIPNSVIAIGTRTFYGTPWYANKPDGLVYAGKVAYRYKGTMPQNTSIRLAEGTLGIAISAFAGCKELKSITIPSSVTSIGNMAFEGCSGLTSVTIPNGVTSIGPYVFSLCSSLTSVTIPNSVKSIGYDAFSKCSSLKSVTIPNSVKLIGERAFQNCSSLKSVTIPNSVTLIAKNAFDDCSSLTSIVVESGNPKYDSRNNCNGIIETETNTLIVRCKNTVVPNDVTP